MLNETFSVIFKHRACCQTVLLDRSVLIVQKLVENAKIQMRHLEYFSNNVEIFESLFLNGFLLEKTLHFEVITGEDDDGCNLVLLLLSNSSFSGMVLAIIERDDEELLVIV